VHDRSSYLILPTDYSNEPRIITLFCFVIFGASYGFAHDVHEGIVSPSHEVELALPIDGVLSKIFVQEGNNVKQGGNLLKLDDTLQQLEVARRKEIYEDNAELSTSRENLVTLKSLLDSSKGLYEKTNSVSQDEVKNLEMQYRTLLGKVNVFEAKKKQELIEYEIAKAVLARYLLTSPIDGRVTVIKREEGEWGKVGEMILTVVDTSVCHVEFNVDEKHARTLKQGDTISVRVSQGVGMGRKQGTVIFISPVADKASALIRVKVEFANADGKVIPGVLASVKF